MTQPLHRSTGAPPTRGTPPATPILGTLPLVLERERGGLQVGLSPGVIVEGAAGPLLTTLRHGGPGWAARQLFHHPAAQHLEPTLVHRLLADLDLVSRTGAGERAELDVLVVGHGHLAHEVERAVAPLCRGVVRRPWDRSDTDPFGPEGLPDLVVLVSSGAAPTMLAETWRALGVTHLPVVSRGSRVVVGPLVGATPGPCLWCLDLFRCDHDPGWPGILRQLSSPCVLGGGTPAHPAMATLAAGLVATVVDALGHGLCLAPGLTLECALPEPTVARRRWRQHPACRCSSTPAADDEGADRESSQPR